MTFNTEQIKFSSLDQRRTWLTNHVRTQIAQILKSDLTDKIDLRGKFDDDIPWWIDSFLLLKFSTNLQSSLGCSLPATIAFEYSTVGALVDYLERELFSQSGQPLQPDESSFGNSKASVTEQSEITELSDSEVETLLISQLDSMRY